MAPLEKPKIIKKASKTAASSPIAGRTRATNPSTTTPTLQEIMEGFQNFLTPQLTALKTDVVESLTASVNDRFLDLENNLDQIKSTVDAQHQDLQDQLNHVLQRLDVVEKENTSLRVSSQQSANQTPDLTSPSQPVLGTNASKYANNSSQETDSVVQSPHASHPKEPVDPLAGGLRYFTPVSKNQGFQHLYVPARGRNHLSNSRKLLIEKAHFKKGSVVDLHYPNSSVIAILVHNDYADTARKLLQDKGLEPIDDFDPYHHSNLGGPALKNMSIEERTAKMKELADKQYYTTIEGLKYKPNVQLAFARAFHRQNKITTEYLKELTNPQSSPSKGINSNAQAQSTEGDFFMRNTFEDDDMEESVPPPHDNNHSNSPIMDATTSSVHPPSTGGGEPDLSH